MQYQAGTFVVLFAWHQFDFAATPPDFLVENPAQVTIWKSNYMILSLHERVHADVDIFDTGYLACLCPCIQRRMLEYI